MKTALRSGIGTAVALLVALGGLPATAGTAADPEITDPAGDGNYVSFLVPGDTRPASFDNLDLRAVWLETVFDARKIIDPATGRVSKIDHVATGLRMHVQTQGPMRPMPNGMNAVEIYAPIKFGTACLTTLSGYVDATDPAADQVELAARKECVGGENAVVLTSGLSRAINGNVLSLTVPFSAPGGASKFIYPGQSLVAGTGTYNGVNAYFIPEGGVGTSFDRTVEGRTFTIGQDVPADVDCAAQPTYPGCSA